MSIIENTTLYIKWGSVEYIEWVNQGRPINETINELDMSKLKINSLIGLENLPNLTNENTYSVESHKELVKKQLEELGYSSIIIEEWINNIE